MIILDLLIMREIKFRGKSNDGKGWLYGDLVRHTRGMMAIVPSWKDSYLCCGDYEVYEQTIGQYTGHHDMNNEEIYEKDIVKCEDSLVANNYGIGVVEWNDRYCAFFVHPINNPNLYMLSKDYSYTIVGNLYDNPELLR